jgi:hypothetical protein
MRGGAGVGVGGGMAVEVIGLQPLLKELRGPAFKMVNSELRDQARRIADGIVPEVRDAVGSSDMAQAAAMVRTVGSKRDRVPVVIIGATNPGLSKFSKRGRPGANAKPRQDPRWRRGALAHGVVFGPKPSGPRTSPEPPNKPTHPGHYRMGRREDGGRVLQRIREGSAYRAAVREYEAAYKHVLRRHGFNVGRTGGVFRRG